MPLFVGCEVSLSLILQGQGCLKLFETDDSGSNIGTPTHQESGNSMCKFCHRVREQDGRHIGDISKPLDFYLNNQMG